MKRFSCLLLVVTLLMSLWACQKEITIKMENVATIYDEKFGGFFADISIDEFNALGFTYGDSVNVVLSNGQKLEDIPYYNGYYTRTGYPLVCAYHGYAHVKIGLNNGDDLYALLDVEEDTTVEIVLNEKAKYIDVQTVMDTVYKNERDAFDSDEIFANYRMMVGGNLKEGIFYRSASPIDNEYNRASYADALLQRDGIQLVLNLSDDDGDLQSYMAQDDFNSPYYAGLYQEGKVISLDEVPIFLTDDYVEESGLFKIGSNYRAQDFMKRTVQGLMYVLENDGPYLIHCVEGKDRTGFLAILIECLCDASYDEMLDDYMITYDNYYQINKQSQPKQYEAIVDLKFNDMIFYLTKANDVETAKKADMQFAAVQYLIEGGMSVDDINALIAKLTS